MAALRLLVALAIVFVAVYAAPPAGPRTTTAHPLFVHREIEFTLPINSNIYTVDADKLKQFLETEFNAYIQSRASRTSRRVIREAIRNGEEPPRLKRYVLEANIKLTLADDDVKPVAGVNALDV